MIDLQKIKKEGRICHVMRGSAVFTEDGELIHRRYVRPCICRELAGGLAPPSEHHANGDAAEKCADSTEDFF